MELTARTERERILHERAVALAQASVGESREDDLLEVTVFSLGADRYAIDSTLVQEIIALHNLMPLPCAPPHIAGILNLRGKLQAAVDLRVLLGMPGGAARGDEKVVLLSDGGMEFGLLVDEIEGVQSLPPADIQEGLMTQQGSWTRYLRGVTSDRLVILDGMRLIHDPELIVADTTN